MFNIFDIRRGETATLDAAGVAATIDRTCIPMPADAVAALDKLKPGEWIWWYHFQIIRSLPGLALDELKAR
jgi:hypothetical protein